jgi:hypothetical protein
VPLLRLASFLSFACLLSACGSADADLGSSTANGGGVQNGPRDLADTSSSPSLALVGSPAATFALPTGIWDDNLNFAYYTQWLKQNSYDAWLPLSAAERNAASNTYAVNLRAGKSLPTELELVWLVDEQVEQALSADAFEDQVQALMKQISSIPDLRVRVAWVSYGGLDPLYLLKSLNFSSDVGKLLGEVRKLREKLPTSGDPKTAGARPLAQALEATAALRWTDDERVAKMAFWLAGPVGDKKDGERLADAVRSASKRRIALYPVAARGEDARAAYVLRGAAQVSGGRYLFLTESEEVRATPNTDTPCFFVSSFANAGFRAVRTQLSGQRVPADATAKTDCRSQSDTTPF